MTPAPPHAKASPSGAGDPLGEYRRSIDNMDGAVMFILSERMRAVKKINALKESRRAPGEMSAARRRDIARTTRLASRLGLSGSLISGILERIYHESLLPGTGPGSGVDDFRGAMKELRSTLLNLDSAFCYLLAERFRLVEAVGRWKKERGIPSLSEKRWREVMETRTGTARRLGIGIGLVTDILEMIHREALRIEESLEP